MCPGGAFRVATVAPYAGAWIETKKASTLYPASSVAPYAGAWIETNLTMGMQRGYSSRVNPPSGVGIE